MLENCAAIHLASDRDWIARSTAIAQSAGFAENYPYLSVEDIARRARHTPIQFLFAHYQFDDSQLRNVVADIRSHHEHDVKFMALVVFTKDASPAALKHFLAIGFDDIVVFPCNLCYLVTRLAQQIGRPLDYFQARAYFGPDRRRMLNDSVPQYTHDAGPYTQFLIERDVHKGVRVVSQARYTSRASA